MKLILVARETIKIIKKGEYTVSGKTVRLPKDELSDVIVYMPKKGNDLVSTGIERYKKDSCCKIVVTTEDSYQAGRRYDNVLVMNFANAVVPGGGFLFGATAQEESLCRCSTLYASIKSKKAKEMYRYNNSTLSFVDSDYMLLSKNVYVIRDEKLNLLETPVKLGVITVPAPDRRLKAALASPSEIEEVMIRRIRIMLKIAMEEGYKNLVLGAWGCGAFGNKPENVSKYFKKIIIDEGYGYCFDEICFAIYGKADGKNYIAFDETFVKM